MMTDPIADMLTRIRNAVLAGRRSVEVPASKLKKALAEILQKEGYIEQIELTETKPTMLLLTLAYRGKQAAIHHIARESKPGHRKYRPATELASVLNGYGISVISTSQGLMTNKEARKRGIGGEVICSIY